jgi:hypothetical protein
MYNSPAFCILTECKFYMTDHISTGVPPNQKTFKKWVKMNGLTDLNETHESCGESNLCIANFIPWQRKYFPF